MSAGARPGCGSAWRCLPVSPLAWRRRSPARLAAQLPCGAAGAAGLAALASLVAPRLPSVRPGSALCGHGARRPRLPRPPSIPLDESTLGELGHRLCGPAQHRLADLRPPSRACPLQTLLPSTASCATLRRSPSTTPTPQWCAPARLRLRLLRARPRAAEAAPGSARRQRSPGRGGRRRGALTLAPRLPLFAPSHPQERLLKNDVKYRFVLDIIVRRAVWRACGVPACAAVGCHCGRPPPAAARCRVAAALSGRRRALTDPRAPLPGPSLRRAGQPGGVMCWNQPIRGRAPAWGAMSTRDGPGAAAPWRRPAPRMHPLTPRHASLLFHCLPACLPARCCQRCGSAGSISF